MNGSTKREREKLLSRAMMILAALVLIAGLIFQISMRARVSAQSKEIASVQRQIQTLNADIMNLNLCINQSHNLEAIAARAPALGMEKIDESRVRVVSLYAPATDTSAQTVAVPADRN